MKKVFLEKTYYIFVSDFSTTNLKMNVHFLDDDYSTNRFHEITLSQEAETLSASIVFFDHPIELLEQYEKHIDLPDILFIDINMPMIDGWTFLEKYNKLFPTAQTKAIILTTAHNPTISEKSKTYPNVKQIAIKPLSPDIFKQMAIKYSDQ